MNYFLLKKVDPLMPEPNRSHFSHIMFQRCDSRLGQVILASWCEYLEG